ncbi:MAG TPA: DUF3300 domain-containing protein [Nitrospirota bacterium]|nr:DUF3300 domain-containing protein [Nitrospirota bacterium]
MIRTCIKGFLLVFIVCLQALLSIQARAEDPALTYSVSFTDDELDNLLAPIALYPDPLLAQILPASTYPTEVADADAWLKSGGDVSRIDEQDWAESVRAIAHYPSILQMMAENMDWTANLGDAFLNQPEDVTSSIQRLRWRARAVGNLVSNADQSVIIEGDYIQIVPAQPQYMYVPQYDASVVYVQAPTVSPFVTFGFGLAIGGWLSLDFDWDHHHVIYHGWDRPGWVNRARPYVHVSNVYINNSRPFINQTWRHDRSHGDPARYLASRPSGPNAERYQRMGEARGSTTMQPKPAGGMYGRGEDIRAYSNRGQESRGIVNQQPAPLAPSISQRPTIPAPGSSQRPTPVTPPVSSSVSNLPGSARASQQPARTPSVTFGGYRGAGEAKTQSLRGQTSRQSSEQVRPSAPPERRGSAPAGRNNAPGDRQRR